VGNTMTRLGTYVGESLDGGRVWWTQCTVGMEISQNFIIDGCWFFFSH
jgi:hypothetical protein